MNANSKIDDRSSTPFLTDGGLETTLIFHEGIDLPEFAAYTLLLDEAGRAILREYSRRYLDIAAELGMGFILESPTWRANADWGHRIGHTRRELNALNELSIAELVELRDEYSHRVPEMKISGCIGPRGDGYAPSNRMTADEAQVYHSTQIDSLAGAGAEILSAMTLNYIEEAVGIVRAARSADIPSVISFTLETDGCLPDGESLREAVERTDAETDGAAAYFMINCAHPTHFEDAFEGGNGWVSRIGGVRANASRLSHAELDESETLDDGDPADLADRLRRLQSLLPDLSVFGGCCGTDHRHVHAVGRALL